MARMLNPADCGMKTGVQALRVRRYQESLQVNGSEAMGDANLAVTLHIKQKHNFHRQTHETHTAWPE